MIALERGDDVPYDRLLVTTGGRNRPVTTPGADLPGIFQLRTVDDCDRIRAAARPGRRAVVIGMGFIGSEVAASLVQLGLHVAAVEGHPVPLARVLGPEVGGVLAEIHRDKGVELCLGDAVTSFEGAGRVERVRTRQGKTLPCDLVVAGIGIVPNSELLAEAGAAVDNGVLVDERCRTSAARRIRRGRRGQPPAPDLRPAARRALEQRRSAGARRRPHAARRQRPYDYLHSFWSDQYEHLIEYVGFAARWDRLVFRGEPSSRRFLGFYLVDGRIRAAVGLNRGGDPEDPNAESELKAVAKLIERGTPVDATRLADESADLSTV